MPASVDTAKPEIFDACDALTDIWFQGMRETWEDLPDREDDASACEHTFFSTDDDNGEGGDIESNGYLRFDPASNDFETAAVPADGTHAPGERHFYCGGLLFDLNAEMGGEMLEAYGVDDCTWTV